MTTESRGDDIVILVSIQSQFIYSTVMMSGSYQAESVLCVDVTKYSADIKRLGYVPMWGYWQEFYNFDTMWDGNVIRSLLSFSELKSYDWFLFELDIPDELVETSASSNRSFEYIRLFPSIRREYVRAVYKLNRSRWRSKDKQFILTPIYIGCNDPITTVKLDTGFYNRHDRWEDGDSVLDFCEKGREGTCILCGSDTSYLVKGKHCCSLSCLSEARTMTRHYCKSYGVDFEYAMNRLNENDFFPTSRKAVLRLVK